MAGGGPVPEGAGSGAPGAGNPGRDPHPGRAMPDAARVVLVTAPDVEVAERLATTLVEERLVACGTILPGARSIFRWRGDVQREAEALLVLKTTAGAVAGVLARVPALHPYEVPEVLVLAVEAGHPAYLEWLAGSVATLQERD